MMRKASQEVPHIINPIEFAQPPLDCYLRSYSPVRIGTCKENPNKAQRPRRFRRLLLSTWPQKLERNSAHEDQTAENTSFRTLYPQFGPHVRNCVPTSAAT